MSNGNAGEYEKLTTSRLAQALGLKTADLNERLVARGYLAKQGKFHTLTDSGKKAGGESRISQKFGLYFLWPKNLDI